MTVESKTGTSTAITRVLCVDDNSDMTEVMRLVVDSEPQMACVGCLASADNLVKTIRSLTPQPNIVLLDASMPGKDPLAVMKQMVTLFPNVRTIIYSGHEGQAFVDRVKAAGAWGCISKRDEPEVIVTAIRAVAAGKPHWRVG